MPWNEPGNGQNPWNKRPGGGGPPDLDEVVRNMQRKLSGLFGGRRGGGGQGASGGSGGSPFGLGLVIAIVLIGWAATGIYKVDAAERGVVLRFGKYHATVMPGLHWRVPWPVDSVLKVNINRIDFYRHQTRMLTADENIVEVDMAVQYRRTDPQLYLFNVRDPEQTLNEVSESAIREIVGKNQMDFVLTEGRPEITRRTMALLQETLTSYGTGIEVMSVNLQDANFPSQVQAAVQDAIKAREDKDRLILEAQAYENDVVPRARGAAARRLQEAQAYRDQVIANAQGEAARFTALLDEYEKAPRVTRERLYLETMESVLGSTGKVLLDAEGSGNLIYLPIDKLLEGRARQVLQQRESDDGLPGRDATSGERRRDDPRARGNR